MTDLSDARLINAKFASTCAKCLQPIVVNQACYWSRRASSVTCERCSQPTNSPWAPPVAAGVAGASLRHKAERLGGRGGSWQKGAEGEEYLASLLEPACSGIGYVLHSRRLPDSRRDIDHIVVVQRGVLVIDAKNTNDAPRRSNYGGRLTTDERMLLGRSDKTMWIEGLLSLTAAVTSVAGTKAQPVMCFVAHSFSPMSIRGVDVIGAENVAGYVRQPGNLGPAEITRIANALAAGLPPKR